MITTTSKDIYKHLVYQTANTALTQCDETNRFIIRLFDERIALTPCALIAFRKKLKDINLAGMFESDHPGVELLSLPHCDRFFAFSIQEILELNDLFDGSFTMLELNSLIHRSIIRK